MDRSWMNAIESVMCMRMTLKSFFNLLNDLGLPWLESIIFHVLIVWMGDNKKLSWYENIFYVRVS